MNNIPVSDNRVLNLSDDFYNDYPHNLYPELLEKKERPYNCLLFPTRHDFYICIPYRSEMEHTNGYKFRNTQRSLEHQSGLDYSKIVIVKNPIYIGNTDALVDDDEYTETMYNINTIKTDALNYVENYMKHITGQVVMHPRAFQRKYRYTTLKYFHEELGLVTNETESY